MVKRNLTEEGVIKKLFGADPYFCPPKTRNGGVIITLTSENQNYTIQLNHRKNGKLGGN